VATAVRAELRRYALEAGVRRRLAPHQLRHAHAVELAREGVPLPVIQRQLGHSYVSTTSVYLQGINTEEIIDAIHARRAPMMHVSADSNPEQYGSLVGGNAVCAPARRRSPASRIRSSPTSRLGVIQGGRRH
jgi:hypothetical protein